MEFWDNYVKWLIPRQTACDSPHHKPIAEDNGKPVSNGFPTNKTVMFPRKIITAENK